eukprot:141981_1
MSTRPARQSLVRNSVYDSNSESSSESDSGSSSSSSYDESTGSDNDVNQIGSQHPVAMAQHPQPSPEQMMRQMQQQNISNPYIQPYPMQQQQQPMHPNQAHMMRQMQNSNSMMSMRPNNPQYMQNQHNVMYQQQQQMRRPQMQAHNQQNPNTINRDQIIQQMHHQSASVPHFGQNVPPPHAQYQNNEYPSKSTHIMRQMKQQSMSIRRLNQPANNTNHGNMLQQHGQPNNYLQKHLILPPTQRVYPMQQQAQQMMALSGSQRSMYQQQAKQVLFQHGSAPHLGLNHNNNNNNNNNMNAQRQQHRYSKTHHHIGQCDNNNNGNESFLPPAPQSSQEQQKYNNWKTKRKVLDQQKAIDLQKQQAMRLEAAAREKERRAKFKK